VFRLLDINGFPIRLYALKSASGMPFVPKTEVGRLRLKEVGVERMDVRINLQILEKMNGKNWKFWIFKKFAAL
jgi:hypothetical protein